MVNAELSHNPFLLETEVLFNGRAPGVNSAVHKYKGLPLADWVQETPRIFHDEMNGYDFSLGFTGTESDFKSVVSAFREQGISEKTVPITLKATLKSANDKREELAQLLEWLKENPCDRLDYDAMVAENPELLESSVPLLLLHGTTGEKIPLVNIEVVDDAADLDSADLRETPILVYVSPETAKKVKKDVRKLLPRKDVDAGQLFFAIDAKMNDKQVVRVLSDLGVAEPQVVDNVDAPEILGYIRDYPVATYVRDSIHVLSREERRITAEIEEAEKRSEWSSANKVARVDECDKEIVRLRDVDARIAHSAIPDNSHEFLEVRVSFTESIAQWKARKRRIEGEREAKDAAESYEELAKQYLAKFMGGLSYASEMSRSRMLKELGEIYQSSGIDTDFKPSDIPLRSPASYTFPEVRKELLALHETVNAAPRTDFLAFLGATPVNRDDQAVVNVYQLDKWRARANELFTPVLDTLITDRNESLQAWHAEVVNAYRAHIAVLIEARRRKKQAMSAKLSGEERALQQDSEWLATFKSKLDEIKRG